MRHLKGLLIILGLVFLMGCGNKVEVENENMVQQLEDTAKKESEISINKKKADPKPVYDLEVIPEKQTDNFIPSNSFDASNLLRCSGDDHIYNCPGDHFYPIGWSKDGKFAYFDLHFNEDGLGGYKYQFSIIDVGSNEKLWSLDGCNIFGFEECSTLELAEFWNENRDGIYKKLNEYQINQNQGVDLKEFPLIYMGNKMSVVHEQERTDYDEGFGMDFTKSVDVILAYDDRKNTIYSKSFGDYGPILASSHTYIKSPYQNMIIVIVNKQFRGWEGPPSRNDIDLVPVDLDEIFPSKTPIKDYVGGYLKKNNGCYPYEFQLNNSSDGKIYLNVDANYGSTNFTCCYEGRSSSCVSRSDEGLIRNLEKTLNDKFDLNKKLVFKYNNEVAYADGKYINETAIKSLSPDGRYAELDFPMGGPGPQRRCYFFDMEDGSCISPIDREFTDDFDDLTNQINIEREKLSDKYGITKNFDKSLGFYHHELNVDDEVEIYGKRLPSESEYAEVNSEWAHLNYRHISTRIEMPIYKSLKELKEDFYVGLYGHSNMLGLVLLTKEYWEGEELTHTDILPQSLLDEKLAQLYNNVAMHYYEKQDYKQAIEYFNKALDINGQYAQANFNKASTHALLKQADESIESLKKAIEIEPEKFIEKAKSDKDFDDIREKADFVNLIGE